MIEIKDALKAILPEIWLTYFEVAKINEKENEWEIILHEKEDKIPAALEGEEVAKDGFTNPVEINDYPLRGKPTYLKFYRRKWKRPGEKKSYTNTYYFHPPGMKATEEFGLFLKELDREETDKHNSSW